MGVKKKVTEELCFKKSQSMQHCMIIEVDYIYETEEKGQLNLYALSENPQEKVYL